MQRKTQIYTYLLLPLFLMAGFASCTRSTDERAGYAHWDEDSDERLDEREFNTAWEGTGYLSRWDANNDGYVDESEWHAGRETYLSDQEDIFRDLDVDGDNRLSPDELEGGVRNYYDRDQDRYITESEYNEWFGERATNNQ